MDQIKTPLPHTTHLDKFKSDKGDVKHGIKSSDKSFMGFGEAYFSSVRHDVTKGWKLHKNMTLNLIVPHGEINFIVHDGKNNKSLIDPLINVTIGDNNYLRLTVPPGFWVAFKGVGKGSNLLLNIASIEHNPDESENRDLNFFKVKGLTNNE